MYLGVGGRTLEEKDGWWGGESREWAGGPGPRRGWPGTLWAGGLVLASSASLPSRDSKQAGCFLPMFGVPQTISVWVSCRRGSGKTGIVLSLLSPESEWGGRRVQTGEQVLVLPVAPVACTSSPPGGSLGHRCPWSPQEPSLDRETAQFGLKVEGRAREDQLVWWK